ncbi:MAG: general stress protein CsbD [Bacteroidetes bacterium]|nr:general stress protein CsbD [Bacteroidales bacterium]NJO68193.1 general stress protein CsbD [Bacteroidota bacterium]
MQSKSHHQAWHQLRDKLMRKFPQLTISDLYDRGGEEDELIQQVAHKLKKTTSEVREIISRL